MIVVRLIVEVLQAVVKAKPLVAMHCMRIVDPGRLIVDYLYQKVKVLPLIEDIYNSLVISTLNVQPSTIEM